MAAAEGGRGDGGPRRRRAPGRDAVADALRHVARRSRTSAEVRCHLEARGHDGAAAGAAVARLVELGYLDDHALAGRAAARAASERPAWRALLERDLARRGVDRETIRRALETAFGPEQEESALSAALERAVRRAGGRTDGATLRRLTGALARRGFAPGRSAEAVAVWARGRGAARHGR